MVRQKFFHVEKGKFKVVGQCLRHSVDSGATSSVDSGAASIVDPR